MGYTTPTEMRSLEGLPAAPPTGDGPTDPQLQASIDEASALIDEWCGWWFEPRLLTLKLPASGDCESLDLPAPPIAITHVKLFDGTGAEIYLYDPVEYVVMNRHLSGGPDDRRWPRIERRQENFGGTIISSGTIVAGKLVWPISQDNLEVKGKMGYTDRDLAATPNTEGVTPAAIKRIVRKMVLKMVWPRWSHADMAALVDDGRVTSERTRDQAWTKQWPWTGSLAGGTGIGAWTGDPEIDRVIATYQKPFGVAFV